MCVVCVLFVPAYKIQKNINSSNVTTAQPTATGQHLTNEPFNSSRSQWSRWVHGLEAAYDVFGISPGKKVSYTLHYIEPEVYEILSDKLARENLHTSDYKNIADTMGDY